MPKLLERQCKVQAHWSFRTWFLPCIHDFRVCSTVARSKTGVSNSSCWKCLPKESNDLRVRHANTKNIIIKHITNNLPWKCIETKTFPWDPSLQQFHVEPDIWRNNWQPLEKVLHHRCKNPNQRSFLESFQHDPWLQWLTAWSSVARSSPHSQFSYTWRVELLN